MCACVCVFSFALTDRASTIPSISTVANTVRGLLDRKISENLQSYNESVKSQTRQKERKQTQNIYITRHRNDSMNSNSKGDSIGDTQRRVGNQPINETDAWHMHARKAERGTSYRGLGIYCQPRAIRYPPRIATTLPWHPKAYIYNTVLSLRLTGFPIGAANATSGVLGSVQSTRL